MKIKNILLGILPLGAALMLSGCSNDSLEDESVIVTTTREYNDFDKWLEANYINPYNISFKYRYEEMESDLNYYTVPAEYSKAVQMAHVVKYICMESYDEVAGIEFTRSYFPKEFFLIGEWEYRNNGTFILGTAENGKKILLSGINYFDKYKKNVEMLNHYYLKTIHHEFVHIMDQTKARPVDFKTITGTKYVSDMWSEEPYNKDFLKRGFISAYSQQEDTEDFAEMISIYVCNTQSQWDKWMKDAGPEGATLINAKLTLVKTYMKDNWNIDLNQLRDVVQRRESDLAKGNIDLYDLTVK